MPRSLRKCLLILTLLPISASAETAPSSSVRTDFFSVEVMSVLSKAGCNAGTCHGNLHGKGGLKLSLRGQNPSADFLQLTAMARGRRINLASPEKSLILRKAVGELPHRGGVRFTRDSSEYHDFVEWLTSGAPAPKSQPTLTRQVSELRLNTLDAVVFEPEAAIQLQVTAVFENGDVRDVTDRACYELSNLNASVSPSGRVSRAKYGETTVIVRYLDRQVPVKISFREATSDYHWTDPSSSNLIDQQVYGKLRRQRINPSPRSNDSVFLRRTYLDLIGRLPSSQEAASFLTDTTAKKRQREIDKLLSRPEFADFWALKFADLLRVEEKVLDPRGVEIFHGWIRDAIQQAMPLDEFARQLVTGTGSTFERPPANFYRANRDASTRGETTARLFLGTRLQCAKCHNHPFDRWTQQDYYQWANLFSQLEYELGENKRKDKLDKNEFAGEQTVLVSNQPELKNPSTGEAATAKFLGGAVLSETQQADRLGALSEWLTSPENELFVESQVNFVWFQLLGKGLVDPVDDFRLTNPPSNAPLLDALADYFIANQFDLRQLIRFIAHSQTYQASSVPNDSNGSDEINFSRAYVRRYPAEVLLDMQCDVLELPAAFAGYPLGMRAVQVPGIERVRKRDKRPKFGDRFLRSFGKPPRILACDCERSNESNLKQVLGLVGSELDARLRTSPKLKRLADSKASDSSIVESFYLSALTRFPTPKETEAAINLIAQEGREVALQDLAWAILNAKEFMFRR